MTAVAGGRQRLRLAAAGEWNRGRTELALSEATLTFSEAAWSAGAVRSSCLQSDEPRPHSAFFDSASLADIPLRVQARMGPIALQRAGLTPENDRMAPPGQFGATSPLWQT